jgi:hypothetical protein
MGAGYHHEPIGVRMPFPEPTEALRGARTAQTISHSKTEWETEAQGPAAAGASLADIGGTRFSARHLAAVWLTCVATTLACG